MPIVSTNDIQTHRQVKARAAEKGSTLGKLFDLYAKIGLTLKLEDLNESQIEELLKKINEK